ncbi:hypothetical protein EVS84_02820 [Pseudomonas koreensis]|uniref:DUF1534 domain-containing protein n=1 Tax=Pseudomonas koreensis TaxID=198620 RepID=A0A4Q4L9V8_9PSED|nr:hypothetical protein EVS84_02820 [Pseudomonas koreensis]
MTFNRLLPLGVRRSNGPMCRPCGSGLARECGGSVISSLFDTPLSRASPLPQGICVSPNEKGNQHGNVRRSTGQAVGKLRGRAGVRHSRCAHR